MHVDDESDDGVHVDDDEQVSVLELEVVSHVGVQVDVVVVISQVGVHVVVVSQVGVQVEVVLQVDVLSVVDSLDFSQQYCSFWHDVP